MISGASEEELELANAIADILLLQKENEQLKNNWNELLNWLESKNKIILQQHKIVEPVIKIQEVIDKIKEDL